MPTAYITHSDCYKHLTPMGHPEQVDRLRVIEDSLAKSNFDTLLRISAPVGTMDQVRLCHPQDYVLQIKNACPNHGYVTLDGDTHVSVGSFDAAMRAVGGVCSAIDLVIGGEARNAFVLPAHQDIMQKQINLRGFVCLEQFLLGQNMQ